MGTRDAGAGLEVEQIVRRFGAQRAVDGVSFTVSPGELVALVGASGSGKTTTLRIVAGYETPDAGQVRFGGREITRARPERRDFGMVFQHYALFPHMSVAENVAFGLEARGVAKRERLARAEAALATVGLAGKGSRGVQQLSGGEQQRVALARALTVEPRMLLLDEPLSNLDPALRQSTREELRATLRRAGAPALFVTHDQEDAFAIADRIVLLSRGRVLQIGAPEELYSRPADREVAAFIGHAAMLPARREGDHAVVTLGGVARDVRLTAKGAEQGVVVVRPEALAIGSSTDPEQGWAGTVQSRRFAGAVFVYRIAIADTVVEAVSRERYDEGTAVGVRIVQPVPMVA